MRRFIKNLILIALPFFFYLILVIIIDPYNYVGKNSLVKNNIKKNIAENIEPHLYKLIEFENNPKANIVLGDSRSNGIFSQPATSGFSNLSFGGASLHEMIKTFWYTSERVKLDTVLIGINFNLYNKYDTRFWIEETLEHKRNLFSYSFNRYTFQSILKILEVVLFKKEVHIGEPPYTREEFWQFQLNETATKFYSSFAMPDNYYKELMEISRYCEEKGITLIFWIPPTHIEFQNRIKDFNLVDKEKQFKVEMKTLGNLYDFDYPSELTSDKNNFMDPMHFNKDVAGLICDEMFSHKLHFARYTSRTK